MSRYRFSPQLARQGCVSVCTCSTPACAHVGHVAPLIRDGVVFFHRAEALTRRTIITSYSVQLPYTHTVKMSAVSAFASFRYLRHTVLTVDDAHTHTAAAGVHGGHEGPLVGLVIVDLHGGQTCRRHTQPVRTSSAEFLLSLGFLDGFSGSVGKSLPSVVLCVVFLRDQTSPFGYK